MNHVPADRNLLVGMLALQLGLVKQTQLMEAMQAWVFRKTHCLEDILLEQAAITHKMLAYLRQVLDKHLELHEGDAARGLGTLPYVGDVCEEIEDLRDPELSQSICSVSRTPAEPAAGHDGLNSIVPTSDSGKPKQRSSERFRS